MFSGVIQPGIHTAMVLPAAETQLGAGITYWSITSL